MDTTNALKSEHSNIWGISLCSACLSQDRDLHTLGEFENIFETLCQSICLDVSCSEKLLCWECEGLLRNVKEFLVKLYKSQLILKSVADDETSFPISLSQLTISETILLDTFEDQEIINTDKINQQTYKHEVPIENCPIKEELNMKIKVEISDNPSIKNIDKENLKELNSIKLEAEDDKHTKKEIKEKNKQRLHNYPKERKRRYIMTYQSQKWKDAVQKIKINNTELKKWLEIERNSEHFNMLKNKCDICLQKLKVDETVWSHQKQCHTVSPSRPYTCAICDVSFPSKSRLRVHVTRHYFIHRCNICGHECYSQPNMKYHLRKSHLRNVVCLQCDASFSNTHDFFMHLRSHPASQHYLCEHCDKKTRSLQFLEKHIKRYHRPQRCEECDITFKSHKWLYNHNRSKHVYQPSEQSFCAPCNKQFPNVLAYKAHLSTAVAHCKERKKQKPKKEVPCPVCLKVYSKNATMMNHFRLVHSRDSRYRCDQCDKSFLNRTKYKDHMQYFHMGMERPKSKICKFCDRGFSSNHILQNHILIHTGDKPHQCTQCPQRFRQKTALQTHLKNVHKKQKIK